MSELMEQVKALKSIEGFVIAFEGGEMYKMKCDWYVQRAKAQSELVGAPEKDLWALVLDGKLDDLAPSLGCVFISCRANIRPGPG